MVPTTTVPLFSNSVPDCRLVDNACGATSNEKDTDTSDGRFLVPTEEVTAGDDDDCRTTEGNIEGTWVIRETVDRVLAGLVC